MLRGDRRAGFQTRLSENVLPAVSVEMYVTVLLVVYQYVCRTVRVNSDMSENHCRHSH